VTEAEILEQAANAIDRMWTLAQWWVAISLGLVTAAHVAAERLNLFILIAIMVLYSAYTSLVALALSWNYHVMLGFFEVLSVEDYPPILHGITHPAGTLSLALLPWLGLAMFICCNAFLIRTYLQMKE